MTFSNNGYEQKNYRIDRNKMIVNASMDPITYAEQLDKLDNIEKGKAIGFAAGVERGRPDALYFSVGYSDAGYMVVACVRVHKYRNVFKFDYEEGKTVDDTRGKAVMRVCSKMAKLAGLPPLDKKRTQYLIYPDEKEVDDMNGEQTT